MRLGSPSQGQLFGEDASQTARLMVYLLLSVALMAMDHRGEYVPRLRAFAESLVEPVYLAVSWPGRALDRVSERLTAKRVLADENRRLRREKLAMAGAAQRLEALGEENRRLRALLDASAGRGFEFRFAELVGVDLDPFSHRVIVDRGADDGIAAGQAVIDGDGVMGQVEDVLSHSSTVRLISDPDHALPVQINRTGLRTVAYGTGETARLKLPNVPLQADVRLGDLVVTSGLGDRFPAGFPVARISAIDRETGDTFALVEAVPTASLDRGREVLIVTGGLPGERPDDPGEVAGGDEALEQSQDGQPSAASPDSSAGAVTGDASSAGVDGGASEDGNDDPANGADGDPEASDGEAAATTAPAPDADEAADPGMGGTGAAP